VHLMFEALYESDDDPAGRQSLFTVSPGIRLGKNVGNRQLVFGAALPVTLHEGGSSGGILAYFSYELPFGR
ncbi:MAG TPA: hypothetical protein VFV33_12045, partial [Gemmatimonadaceae bacterium]|nr:hypothetical protein [Gemmatimonadaceae bacterium]